MTSSQSMSTKDYSKAEKSNIKLLLNVMNECLRKLKDIGYNTKKLYVIYDSLRYELLDDKMRKIISENDLIDYLNDCTISLNNLLEELKKSNDMKNTAARAIEGYNKRINSLSKPSYYDGSYSILTEITRVIVLIGSIYSIFLGVKAGKHIYKFNTEYPEIIKYSADSEGNISNDSYYSVKAIDYEDSMTIVEYLKADDAGFRVRKTYELPLTNDYKLDSDTVSKIDLSILTPVEEVIIRDESINNINSDYYRTFNYMKIDKENLGFPTDFNKAQEVAPMVLSILAGLAIVLLAVFINVVLMIDTEVSSINFLVDIYYYLQELVQYRNMIKNQFNGLKLAKSENERYEKIVDSLCNQIHNNILDIARRLSFIEEYKNNHILSIAKIKENELNESNKTNEILNNISEIISSLTKELSKFNNKDDYKKILHTIPISENVLFENVDDHLRIKNIFIPILKFLDLSFIRFNNVDCTNIDFSETNAVLNLQLIYNKDISYSKFNNRNIPDWSDYDGVNITGTTLKENQSTMINIDSAIKDEKTLIKM